MSLARETVDVLISLRSYDGPTDELGREHIRLNVLMRKGLARNLGPGLWEATDLGRTIDLEVL